MYWERIKATTEAGVTWPGHLMAWCWEHEACSVFTCWHLEELVQNMGLKLIERLRWLMNLWVQLWFSSYFNEFSDCTRSSVKYVAGKRNVR